MATEQQLAKRRKKQKSGASDLSDTSRGTSNDCAARCQLVFKASKAGDCTNRLSSWREVCRGEERGRGKDD